MCAPCSLKKNSRVLFRSSTVGKFSSMRAAPRDSHWTCFGSDQVRNLRSDVWSALLWLGLNLNELEGREAQRAEGRLEATARRARQRLAHGGDRCMHSR